MGRKVFISFLGATNYGLCDYQINGISYGGRVRFIQEATIKYLISMEKWTEHDTAFILLTNMSEKKNWLDDGQTNGSNEIIRQEGLKSRLEQMNLPFPIIPVSKLPDGNTEGEIWEIFNRIFSLINDDDDIYFDITHAFRYLPMLMVVLGNYSKFLKNTTIKSITYGNYEVSEKGSRPGPIVNLLPLSSLQDWTYAAGQFIESGNIHKLEELCTQSLTPILKESKGKDEEAVKLKKFVTRLKEVIEERQTCRGLSIIKSESFEKLKECTNKLDTTPIQPLNPIFAKIKDSFSAFDENENLKNGLSAAIWCYNNGLFQQSATILQEFVVSFFCSRHNIPIEDESIRDYINSAFLIKFRKHEEDECKWDANKDKKRLKDILDDSLLNNNDLVNDFHNLTEVRNDINHSGMRSKRMPLSAKAIKQNIRKCLDDISRLLYNPQDMSC